MMTLRKLFFSCQPMKRRQLMGGSRGWTDPLSNPPENSSKIGFLCILVQFSLKSQSYQASIRCWAISGTPAKRHLSGVWLGGQWWSPYRGVWILSHHQLKHFVKAGPPLTKLPGSAHAAGQLCFNCEVRFCALRPPRATQPLIQKQHVA